MRDYKLAHTFCFWKLFRTFTGKMTRGLSLRMVFSLLFQDTLFLLHQIGKKCSHFYLTVRRSLSPPLFGVASTPALVLRRVAPALGLVNPALLPAVTLRSPRRYFQILRSSAVSSIFPSAVISILLPYFHSTLYKTTLYQGPRLEDRKPP